MAAPTPKEVRLRIEAILATIPEVNLVITDEECSIAENQLLAVLVGSRAATRTRSSTDKRLVTRTFELGVLLAKLCSGTVEEQREQMLNAEDLAEIIPDFFAQNAPRLELLKRPLTGVWSTDEMTDNGLETRPWGDGNDIYYAVTYSFPVTTQRA